MSDNILGFMAPRADLKPELFDTAIKQKGYRVIWEQGMFCSCYRALDGQPDFNCPACGGKGYVYFDPKETRVVVTSISGRKEQEHIGLTELGGAYLTPLSTDNVGFRDRFTFLDFTMKYSELLTRGSGTTDVPRYDMIDIICVRVRDKVYNRNIHFTIPKDGSNINWTGNHLPEGTVYSVLYTTQARYIAINPIHELRGTYTYYKTQVEKFVQLPKQFQIKREDLVPNVESTPG